MIVAAAPDLRAGDDISATLPITISSASEIDYPPFCIVEANGHASGFSIELMRSALAAMGHQVTFRTGHWSQVKDWLAHGEIQALPLVGRTPEREMLFDFTVPYMTLHGAIVVREDNDDIHLLADLKGRQVAVMKNDNAEEFLRRENRGIDIHTTATFQDALRGLSQGNYEAVVIQRLVALRLIQEAGLTNLKIINQPIEGFRQDFCFAVREGDRATLALLNEGLALVIADGTYRHLHATWFATLELPTHRRLVIGGDYDYPPFEFLDKNGLPAGYNVDITRAIAKEMGLDIEIRLGPWSEIVNAMKRGEVDALQGMFYSAQRDLAFDFTAPHVVNHNVVVVRKEQGVPPEAPGDLAGKRIVVQQGDIMSDFAMAQGLSERMTAVSTQEQALRELAAGHYDCALVSRLAALYWIKKNGWTNLIVGKSPLTPSEYCYAVPQNHKALLAQLAEGLKTIEENGEYHRIYQKWMGVYEEATPGFKVILRYVSLVAAPLFLLLLAFFLWSWSLRKEVGRRTLELAEVSNRHLAILAAVPDIIMEVNQNKIYTWANQAGLNFFGEDVIGQEAANYFVGSQQTYGRVDRLFDGDETVTYVESWQRRRDGQPRLLAWWCRVLKDKSGKVLGALSSARDITEQKQAEQTIQENEIRYRTILDNSCEGIILQDASGRIITWNMAAQRTFGVTERDVLGHTSASRQWNTIREDGTAFPASEHPSMVTLVTGSPCKDVVMGIQNAAGQVTWININTNPLFMEDQDQPYGVVITFSNITDLKRAEQAALSAAREWQTTFDATKDAIWVLDPDQRVQRSNKAAEQLFKQPREQMIGKHCWEIMHGTDQPFHDCPTVQARESENRETLELQVEAGWFLVTADPIMDADGRYTGTVHIISDISERKREEIEREKMQARFLQAQKMESVGRLAGGVAHDFNNMLSVILGYTELALESVGPSHPLHADLVEILKAADRSQAVTRQLLAYARKQTISPLVIDLNETIEGMLKMLRRLIGEDIELCWKPAMVRLAVKMDPSQIDQVLANLCVNARDAIKDVGRITIETDIASFDADYCADHAGFIPGDFIQLTIGDNGCGMDAPMLANIFEPFFTTKGVGQGTGLGLSTVYGIVQQNNGFIDVWSEPGKGTAFRIYLPRHAGQPVEIQRESAHEVPSGRGETILLSEDDASLLNLCGRMLEELGYKVLSAPTPGGLMHLANAYAGRIDLLVTDVIMPEMNGRDLSNHLRKRHPELKTLFMSGYSADVIAHREVLDEGVCFIPKPFTKKDLAIKIREALERGEPEARSA